MSTAEQARAIPNVPVREKSWGEGYRQSPMDRFGIWLSTVQIRRQIGSLRGKDVADFGCGFHAAFSRTLIGEVRSLTLVDLSLSPALAALPGVRAIEGLLPGALEQVEAASLDVVICNNVLEHLWEPHVALGHIRRVLRPGGACFLNVPSWRGKLVLETAAFRLGWTSRDEINDHKAYYDARAFWALLVRSGFRPDEISVGTHKLGLNTYAVCRLRGS